MRSDFSFRAKIGVFRPSRIMSSGCYRFSQFFFLIYSINIPHNCHEWAKNCFWISPIFMPGSHFGPLYGRSKKSMCRWFFSNFFCFVICHYRQGITYVKFSFPFFCILQKSCFCCYLSIKLSLNSSVIANPPKAAFHLSEKNQKWKLFWFFE